MVCKALGLLALSSLQLCSERCYPLASVTMAVLTPQFYYLTSCTCPPQGAGSVGVVPVALQSHLMGKTHHCYSGCLRSDPQSSSS